MRNESFFFFTKYFQIFSMMDFTLFTSNHLYWKDEGMVLLLFFVFWTITLWIFSSFELFFYKISVVSNISPYYIAKIVDINAGPNWQPCFFVSIPFYIIHNKIFFKIFQILSFYFDFLFLCDLCIWLNNG